MAKSDKTDGGYGKISGDILEEKEGSESGKNTESRSDGNCERIRAEVSSCMEAGFCMEEVFCMEAFFVWKRVPVSI